MDEHPQGQSVQVAATSLDQRARLFVQEHGKVRVAILAGGVGAALGALLPFADTSGLFGGHSSVSIVQTGFYGLLLLLLPIALAVFPILGKQHSRFNLLAFGISSALLGIFFAIWISASGIGSAISAGVGSLSAGFYLTLLGYGAAAVGYYLLAREPVAPSSSDQV
jgi:hypothetical protein